MEFGLATSHHGEHVVLAVTGDLDVLTAPQLRDRLVEVIDGGDKQVVVDLTPCEFVDSSGLSALVSAYKRMKAMGGDLGLLCPPGNIRRLIEVVALDQVFTMYDDQAELA